MSLLKIKTDILISEPIDKVWSTFRDFESYPTWNPFVTRVVFLSEKQLEVDLGQGKSKMTMQPEILVDNPPHEFRWKGKLVGSNWLFVGQHYYVFSTTKEGTLFQHGEDFHGILAWLLWPLIKPMTKANFIKMNEALKSRVENISEHS